MRKLALSDAERRRIARLYVDQGLSIVELAARLHVSEPAARRRLHAAGIPARPAVKRSRLRKFDQGKLFSAIIDRGVVKAAQERGIPPITLKKYLAGLRREAKKR